VPEGNVEALAAALRALSESAERRAALGERGRARVLARYTNERIAMDTVRFYHRVLNGARA
jgi:glycosyltransferase involved in cell wall biosynthesis